MKISRIVFTVRAYTLEINAYIMKTSVRCHLKPKIWV